MNETIVKHLNFGEDAKKTVFNGIDKLTKAVSSTLGASGKCVILEDNAGNPQITKDGVTVADSIVLLDPVENIGAKLIKQAAQKTVKDAGDGTTTATILAHAIIKEAHEHSELDDLRSMKEGINLGLKKVLNYLSKKRKKVKGAKIDQVATISANNDKELGKTIGSAFKMVDETGVVTMELSDLPKTTVDLVEGFKYPQPLFNNHFITNKEKKSAELEDPLILIIENEVDSIRKIQSVLEYVIKNNKSLLIIANVDQQVSSALAMNKLKGNIKVNIIEAPFYGINRKEMFNDLCDMTGATLINEDLGDDMDLIQPEHLGSCKKAISTLEHTILQVDNDKNEKIKETISYLEKQLESASASEKINIEKRLGGLKAKVAIIKLGANSEVELKEKRDRVEDAICATKAAIKEGIVPGGGIALLNASQNLNAESIGEEVLFCAIRKPYETILQNAGIDHNKVSIREEGIGLNVVTGDAVNMVKAGIIDPLLVTKSALINAVSVATTILSTDCVINNLRA